MTYYEKINEMRETVNLELENARETYLAAEAVLVNLFGEQIKGAEIKNTTYGIGRVVKTYGSALDNMYMEIAFNDTIKSFGVLPVITGNVILTKFADISEIGDAWGHAFDFHTDMTRKLQAIETVARQAEQETQKKAEEEKKAEARYKQQKEKAIRDFDTLTAKAFIASDVDEFYYTLGWLASNVGTISAALPDYLANQFAKHFGSDTPCRVVDSKKKGPAGYTSQWSWSFAASIKNPDTVPALLTKYLNPTGKSVTDTSFVWDLVDNYGFQFGKKQDVNKIVQTVPAKYIDSFNEGLVA